MKTITLQIKWSTNDISILTQETKAFEKKLRSIFNEVSILLILEITQENKNKTKVTKKKKKKEVLIV